ncbi:hypothetical protein IKF89_02795 [Candidatus Saccharibacteria bacterium]|nr:hypothetical protein [Candidatus Saccharibacteria bacterium]
MVLAGSRQWRQLRRQVVRQYDNKPLMVIAAALAFVFACMFVGESHDGIVQYFANGTMANESVALTTSFGLMGAWLVALTIAWLVLYEVGRIAGNAKAGRLHIQLEEFQQEQEVKEIRRRQARQARQARHGVSLPNGKWR